MLKTDENLLQFIKKNNKLATELFSGHFGLEKENLRVTPEGKLALTAHPAAFGPKEENPFIKTDFSESQVEMITPVCNSIEEVYDYLTNLHNTVSLTLENGELLWPNSNPPILPENEDDIPIAIYADPENSSRLYREHLAKEYGKKVQLLSGIHYNFSFTETFLRALFNERKQPGENYQDYKNRVYVKTTKYFMRNRWLLVYLTGGSPAYLEGYTTTPNETVIAPGVVAMEQGISLRNSPSGYKNKNSLHIDYNSFTGYVDSIQKHIDSGEINSMREFYNPIRLKNANTDQSLQGLAKHGVEYLEIRAIDLDPLENIGVAKETLYFIHMFFIAGLLASDEELCYNSQSISDENEEQTALYGMNYPEIRTCSENKEDFIEAGLFELDKMLAIVSELAPDKEPYRLALEQQKERLLDQSKTIAARVLCNVKNDGYINYHLNVAAKARNLADEKAYQYVGATDMELSTQIVLKSALKKGISAEIIDRSENFVRFTKDNHIEYVKQASKTAKDDYITVLIMENKVVTKQILAEKNVRVPVGESFTDFSSAVEAYERFRNQMIVIKPKSTNYGIGISIFKNTFSEQEFITAVKIAFSHDQTIMVEEFIPGTEYRFLVIDKQVEAVLKRIPANVTGDGIHTVTELVNEKNADPMRGTNHLKPLEKIQKGPEETLMLSLQKMTWDTIPSENQTVYLRENSNVSTGGDSIDVTDKMANSYKQLAIQAASSIGANICGVDIIIPENNNKPTRSEQAAIIELNFNPAIHMHCFPYQGKRQMIGDKILDYLFKVNQK